MREVSITLGGEQFRMAATYGAMRDIEARTGLTLGEIYELVLAQRLKIHEIATIVWVACVAAGENMSDIDAVGQSVFELSISNGGLRQALARYCLSCMYQPDEAKKKFADEVEPLLTAKISTGSM